MKRMRLQELLNKYDELDVIKELKKFKSISVYPKNDIEIFLQEKSIRFEKSCVSTTHLIFDDNIEEMLGYFTIANRSLILSKEELNVLSKTQQKKLSNSGSVLRNGDLMTSSFLLGQLGKNYSDDILKKITGKDLLTSAYNLLLKIKELINTKYVWLECQNESRLINFYRDFGFKLLEHIISDEGLKVMIMELK
ncbi:GNAT family N-acetyltransferase [Leptotrichia sp. oral taxon 223]|nr:GNAT family N-acetyltransferase [Leptotrichia sp. oral taxon 223]